MTYLLVGWLCGTLGFLLAAILQAARRDDEVIVLPKGGKRR